MHESSQVWDAFAELCLGFYTPTGLGDAVRGDRWFAALSRTASSELNVCGLYPGATHDDAQQLADVIGRELPTLVFTSEHVALGAREPFVATGYEVTDTPEPLMRSTSAPEVAPHGFTVVPADGDEQLLTCMRVASEAHHVPVELLVASIGEAARRGDAQVWLGLEDDEPVSTIWLRRLGSTIGVMEMMTPLSHQRRGAGRAVMSTALRESWTPDVTQSVLLSTPAGRHLYESLGFVAVDEVVTCYRGLEDEVLEAIGQPAAT